MKNTEKKSGKPARVSSFRCGDYQPEKVQKAVAKAVEELGGIDRFVNKGDRVLLKANLLVARSVDKLVTTHPEVVRAVVKLVKKAGGKPLIGDSPAIGSAVKVAAKCGIGDVAQEEKVEVVNFNNPVEVDNPSGSVFKKFTIDRAILESDVVINLPKLKTHGQMTLTLGIKNLFGVIPGARKTQWHLAAGTDRMHFARMLVDLYCRVAPRLTIMDGIIAMHGNGPQSGDAKKIGLILGSEDAVALDAVICEIVGLKKERAPTLLAAEELGVGQTSLSDITVAGEQVNDSKVADFVVPKTRDVMALFPGPLRLYLRDWMTARPVLNEKKCQSCLICLQHCPAGVITQENDTLEFDLKRCIRCFCCQEMCPHGAITVGSGPLARVFRF
jgi:uncharacterized protein (DUF362 family)/Pyruvate/2-oxoacid:ferredoxin oxidoreductase delta subunit